MLEPLLSSKIKECVLIFLLIREEGYATEIARFFDVDLYSIQNQLDKLEVGGILISRKVGKTRVFAFNPRYALVDELRSLLRKALDFYPQNVKEDLLMSRRRPVMRGPRL